MTTLRLLVHETCNRYCKLCCNQSPHHDLDSLPVCTDFSQYDEIILTGGEPMIDPLKCLTILNALMFYAPHAKLLMYTAKCRPPASLIVVMSLLDGLTLTLHEQKDVADFANFQQWIRKTPIGSCTNSLQLNYFPDSLDLTDVDTSGWRLNPMEWLEDCPLPENEVLMRWAMPTRKERNYRKAYNAFNISTVDTQS